MPERSISLDVRTPSGQGQGGLPGGTSGGLARQPPDRESVERFSGLLRGSGVDGRASADHAAPGEAVPVMPAGPLSLFATPAAAAGVPASKVPQAAVGSEQLLRDLQDNVKRLLVGEDQRSLRLDLDPAVFPGTSVRVYEDAGAWVAEFSCSNADSFDRLARPAQEMAASLAQALSSDALWRVVLIGIDGADAPEPVESFASAPGGMR